MRLAPRLRGIGCALVLAAAASPRAACSQPLEVWVSIPPQVEMAERVGGDRVRVHALLEPGDSPHTYEPTPRQLAALWEANAYLRIGVPFEIPLLAKVSALRPDLPVADCSLGIALEPIDDGHADAHPGERFDPHTWLDPVLVKIEATAVRDQLCRLDRKSCPELDANLAAYLADLDAVHRRIEGILAPCRGRTMFVFHPAFGYFARRYGLEQIAVEVGGKEPTPRQLAQVVERATASGATALFTQPQLRGSSAAAVAEAVGCRLVALDPMAGDLIANLERMARDIAAALGGGP
ncbi:MAG TPA: zinc ABC transporter substrate-binding protein [Thermoanaerobaculales bacterium]|nr:zinc ABC transporter substrate-binding protein [Thermoanaerobaculales bacterium]HPA81080.1 zinc ABC transporter substrate-binding protein [Thermoanaerobaculales bacterium]HQL30657.1 zinc ABC transporter substrate-binding protein [Thermoanaerobaculales bacterium]HQN95689.1 zinc ABC transporter substrate-binding protein [Thermoanaerobaculales bacterium]HQP43403.1 zinc ABC transporter substrate-binding protein [Thermoanaerobaculales bacterium]